jgi:glycerol-3-phosphate acyltransferase PlsY
MTSAVLTLLLCFLVGYAFGCILTGEILGKIYGVNLKQHGSGNVGTTNALRTMGPAAGAITFLGDVAKTIIPIVLMKLLLVGFPISPHLIALYTGLGAVMGHNFPFYMKFQGGKGMAATAGMILAFADIRIIAICLAVFVISVAVTKYVSLGSLLVNLCFPLGIAIFYHGKPEFLHMLILGLIFPALSIFKHRENIKRLLNGTERKVSFHKEEEDK